MDDLISRQGAINAMRKLHADDVDIYGSEIPECFDDKRAINALETLPAADAVTVIRCEDCKYWDAFPSSSIAPEFHECKGLGVRTVADFFCKKGERETDE